VRFSYYTCYMLWIIGKIHSGFARYLEENAIEYGLFYDANLSVKPFTATRVVSLEMDSLDHISDQLDALAIDTVTGITVSGYENYVVPAAHIAAYFGVPGLSVAAARNATDKRLMRAAFMAYNPEISPAFASVTTWEQVQAFLKTTNFPVILKPAGLMKSLFVTKNNSLNELHTNFLNLSSKLDMAYSKYNAHGAPGMLIEAFLLGSMHTVAGTVDAAGIPTLEPAIVDCIRASDVGIADNYLFARILPSKLDDDVAAQILDVSRQGIAALGLTSCPVHVEIIVTLTGPKIVEIGARAGGYRPLMFQESLGIDLLGAQITNSLGQADQQSTGSKAVACSVIELFPRRQGAFSHLNNQEMIQKLPSMLRLRIIAKNGQIIGSAQDGYKAAALIVLSNKDSNQLQADIQFIMGCDVIAL
jgi:biotin carboxylase